MLPFISNERKRYWTSEAMNTTSESSPPVLIALGALLALASFVYIFLWPKNKATAPLPPGPIGLPFLGYLPFLDKKLHLAFTRLSSIYGPIFKVRLGKKLFIVLNSPALVKEVLRDQDVIFANRDTTIAGEIFSYGGQDIGFVSYGPGWRKLKRIFVNELMSKPSLDACSHLLKQNAKEMVGKLYDGRDKPIDIGEMALITLLGILMSMIWGQTVKGAKRRDIEAEFSEAEAEVIYCLGEPNISDFIPMLARFDIQGIEKRMRKASAWFESIFDSVIDEYYKIRNDTVDCHDHEKGTDFMHLVMNKLDHEENHADSLSSAQVKGLLQDIVTAGTDTSATTIEWAMAELLMHPEVMKRAQEELREVVGLNNLVEEFHIPKLMYLAAIVKETLRLHPPVPLLVPHCSSESTIVGGYSIPKGSQVFVNAYAIHRDPQNWVDPLEFRPQRFLDDMNKSVEYIDNDLEFIPFGSGRRMCPGLPLARRMSLLLLGSMLHAFDWKLPNDEELDLEGKFGIVLKKLKPLAAIPKPRLSSLEPYEQNSDHN